jgi:putative peptide zinc metalloprotease protein
LTQLDAAVWRRRAAALSVSHDGDRYVLGRQDLGRYVAVPRPGAEFVATLVRGGSISEAAEAASRAAGEPVDGDAFLTALTAAGLFDEIDDPGATGGRPAAGRVRRVRWIEGVSRPAARRLFGRTAWFGYSVAAVVAAGILLLRADLRPTWEHAWFLTDPVLSVLAYAPVAVATLAAHEMWHWLAGRAAGVPARFRISYRATYVVFETDLTPLVGLHRRARYGPFLAGLAMDVTLLAVALGLRLLHREQVLTLPAVLDRFLGVTVLAQTYVIVWQWAALPMRTDGYAVLANALRCHNLYRITWLTLRDRLFRLSGEQAAELAAATDRDRQVARGFAVAYVAALTATVWMMLQFTLPTAIALLGWVSANLAHPEPATGTFWLSALLAAYVATTVAAPALLAARERRLRRAGALR